MEERASLLARGNAWVTEKVTEAPEPSRLLLPLAARKAASRLPALSSDRLVMLSGSRSEERRVGKECRSRWPSTPTKKTLRLAGMSALLMGKVGFSSA